MSILPDDQMSISTLIDYLSTLQPLSNELANAYLKNCEVIRLKKGRCILTPVDYNSYSYFIVEGKMRGFIRESGTEITTFFAFAMEPVTALTCPSADENYSREYLQAIEECLIVRIPYCFLATTYHQFPEANIIARKIVALQSFQAQQRSLLARIPNASSRYEKFMQDERMAQAGIPLRYIASYLCIRMETLCRIRSREIRAAMAYSSDK